MFGFTKETENPFRGKNVDQTAFHPLYGFSRYLESAFVSDRLRQPRDSCRAISTRR